MNTSNYIKQQVASFSREWHRTGVFLAGVRSESGFSNRGEGKDLFILLPNDTNKRQIAAHNAIVVGAETDWPELWVRPSYSSYEVAFAQFAQWHADYDYLNAPDKSRYDVDHVFSHTRAGPAQLNMQYVRLALVERSANRSWGSFVEKAMVTTDARHQNKTHHYATLFLLAKLIGLNAPSKVSYLDDIKKLAKKLINQGFGREAEYDLFVFQMQYLYEVEVLNIPPLRKRFP
ncbi:hypothetical protein OLMES_5180 [Oleiphilus messinensis]|uniref:Uncharacterized protein n=1 Tax=Oleiphilus messinensis TaxID=141451 RepID=A0A1Y0IIE6_9GAMM|nr:hypothetical protein [Oleiphilus messinensis]ARU59164.1 hypothetical protein OLMES_5180 [Oleiphilus messinensis]